MPPPGYGAPPPGYGAPPPPPRPSGPPWGKIFGFGCGGCLLLILIFFFMAGSAFKGVVDEVKNRKPLTGAQTAYVGSWTGTDGSTLTIRPDGSGDTKSGGVTITNGTVTIDEAAKTLQLKLLNFQKKWTITEPPSGGRMVLDGVEFKSDSSGTSSTGGTSSGGTDDNPGTAAPAAGAHPANGVPDEATATQMAKESLVLFKTAVDAEDFSAFRESTASAFKNKYTAEQVKEAFKIFLTNKELLEPIGSQEPKVETAEVNTEGNLVIKGDYETTPRLQFELTYTNEDSYWKLIGLNVQRLRQ